jgi:putative ABC transport system permease protein
MLMIAQVALSCVLMVGAGLLSRSLMALQRTDTGIESRNVLSVRLSPVPNGYEQFDAASYYPLLLERIAALPSVRNVGYARSFPHLTMATPQLAPLVVLGVPDRETGAQFDVASPRFFNAVGIRLLRGRQFQPTDDARAPAVAVANEQLARALAVGGEVIGLRVGYGSDPTRQSTEIVGVVSNATLGSLRAPHVPILYLSAAQAGRNAYYPTLQIATDGDAMAIANQVERIVREMGREYVHTTLPLNEYLGHSIATERLAATVASAAALLGVVLALMGVYALLAYSVARRTRELGVRLAIGATPRSIVGLVMRDGVMMTLAGVAVGVPLSLWPARFIDSLLYRVGPADAWTLATTAAFFVTLGLVAGVRPALRASRVEPITALRAE